MDLNVLIVGESGVGKEVIANVIHARSHRAGKEMVKLNCAAFPQTMIEGELFGYVKGSFTGANTNRKGLFEAANTGTVFLDEIGEMSPAMQVKLLRVLQEQEVVRVGGRTPIPIDVRLVAFRPIWQRAKRRFHPLTWVETGGLEPPTPALQRRCSAS